MLFGSIQNAFWKYSETLESKYPEWFLEEHIMLHYSYIKNAAWKYLECSSIKSKLQSFQTVWKVTSYESVLDPEPDLVDITQLNELTRSSFAGMQSYDGITTLY